MRAWASQYVAPDWENTGYYDRLLGVDGRDLAWEFLRRNRGYAAAAQAQSELQPIGQLSGVRIFAAPDGSDAALWGLCFCRSTRALAI